MHSHVVTVRLRDTDAAGVVFYGSLFGIIHDAYEGFMESIDFDIGGLLRDGKLALPIVRAEADFALPIRVGDTIEVEAVAEDAGDSSFTIRYRVLKDGKVAALARTVHVSILRRSGRKTSLPPRLKSALKRSA